MGETQVYFVGEKITVQTMLGRGDQIISRLPDGRVALFDQSNIYRDKMAPDQSVDCIIVAVKENYVILDPINEPKIIEHEETEEPEEPEHPEYVEEAYVDEITKDLEKMIKKAKKKNAEIVPRALLQIIQLQQLTIKLLKEQEYI